MLNFEKELEEILDKDPLGLLNIRSTTAITIDQRLKDSFQEINDFITKNNREPKESSDLFERNYILD